MDTNTKAMQRDVTDSCLPGRGWAATKNYRLPASSLGELLNAVAGDKKLTCDSYEKREIWYFKVGNDVYQGDTAEEAVSEYLSERKG